jgi:hypothetical protein
MLDQLSEGQLKSIINFVLKQNSERVENTLRGRMQEQDTIATGRGLNSIESSVDEYTLTVLGEDYLLDVDQGQPAGTVADIDDLINWVDARGLAPAENVESYAAGVQQAIYKRGTIKRFNYEGANLLQYVLDQDMPKIALDLETKITRELEKAIAKNINKGNR